jgi:hypothetical protein
VGSFREGRRRWHVLDAVGPADFAGQPRTRDITGWGDPRIRFSINLHGAPALNLPNFRGYNRT